MTTVCSFSLSRLIISQCLGTPEKRDDVLQLPDKVVYLGLGVVYVQTGPCAGIDAKVPVKRLRAVVTGADGDPGHVEHGGDVGCMKPLDIERAESRPARSPPRLPPRHGHRRGAVHGDARHSHQSVVQVPVDQYHRGRFSEGEGQIGQYWCIA